MRRKESSSDDDEDDDDEAEEKEDEKKLINPRQAAERSHRPEAHSRSLNPLAYEVLNTVEGGKRKKRYKGRGGRQKQ